jgi:hypothetical protein
MHPFRFITDKLLRTPKRKDRRRVGLHLELLEQRNLLAVAVPLRSMWARFEGITRTGATAAYPDGGNVPDWNDTAYDTSTPSFGTWSTPAVAPFNRGPVDGLTAPTTLLDANYVSGAATPWVTALFRTNFSAFPGQTAGSGRVLCDDGCIAYVNGTEVYRTPNMPADSGAGTEADAFVVDELAFNPFTFTGATLSPDGNNVFALELHQQFATSSDFGFDAELSLDQREPMRVVNAVPAEGSIVDAAPTDFVVHFSNAYDPATVDPTDLTVNGFAADSVDHTGATTLTFHYGASPVTAEGLQSMTMAAGAVTRDDDDGPLDSFSSQFRYDTLRLAVISTDPVDGSVVTSSVATLRLHLNDAVDPTSVDATDLTVNKGMVTSATPVIGNPSAIDYRLSGLTPGPLMVVIAAGALSDTDGNPGLAYAGSFDIDLGTLSFPVPLTAKSPTGSLIYNASASDSIAVADDTDNFSIAVDPGQTFTVLVTPDVGSGLQPTVALYDPSSTLLGGTAASAAGANAILQPTAAGSPGTYTVSVGGALGTTGQYTVRVILNAAVEVESHGGATNDTLLTAQDLNGSFIDLTTGTAQQGAVLGQILVGSDTADFYSFSLAAGQTTTLAVQGVGSSLALLDSSGTALALGVATENASQVISNFGVTSTTTYYAQVIRASQGDYSLIVTRNADFDTERNNDIASAQNLIAAEAAGRRWVVGAIEPPLAPLFATDSSHTSTIQQIDPETGAIIRTIPSPIPVGGGPDGLAFDGSHLFLINAFHNDHLYEIDPNTGALISDTSLNTSPGFIDGVAALGGKIYVSNSDTNQILEFDPTSHTVTRVLSPGVNLAGGLAGITAPNALVATVGFNSVVEIDPVSGSVTPGFNPGLGSIRGVATAADAIYLGGPFSSEIKVVTRGGQFSRIIPYPSGIAALGGDDVGNGPGKADFYKVTAIADVTLEIETRTPADGAGEFVNTFDPMIRLYDAAANLVASNDNGAPDGHYAQLSYLVPVGGAGTYYIEVVSSTAAPTSGEYVLSVAGTTVALPAFTVSAVDPPDGFQSRVAPTQVTVDFNDSILLTSLDASDLTVDGVPATGVTVVDANTVIFSLPALGEGIHDVNIADGAVLDLQGTEVDAVTEQYTLDLNPPTVVASSIQEGDVLPAGDLSFQVTFSEPMNTVSMFPFNYSLHGNLRDIVYDPVSYSYDATGTVLTVGYESLPDDRYTLTLISGDGAFEDVIGWNLDGESAAGPIPPNQSGDGIEGGSFVVDFSLDVDAAGPAAYPMPLTPEAPLGSLVHDATVTNTISPVGDTDIFTLNLDAGQTLTVLVTPGGSLQPTIHLTGPSGNFSAPLTAPGMDAVLQAVAITLPSVYTVTVGGAAGSSGLYTARVILNAALELENHGGASNDTLLTAQDLTGSSVEVGGGADRLAVLGQFNGNDDLYAFHLDAGQFATVGMALDAPAGSFGPRTDYGDSAIPQVLVYGDLNGDGYADMVTANTYDGNNLTVRLNNGNGTFGPATHHGAGTNPFDVALGDVNNDGKLDIVVSNVYASPSDGSVIVLPGTGNGTFGNGVRSFLISSPLGLALADFNGDGKLDVAQNAHLVNEVAIGYGSGNGTFSLAGSYPVGRNPAHVAVADLNGDGSRDLITANLETGFAAGNVSTLLNNGNGTFGSHTSYFTDSTGSLNVAVGDLNGDGRPDVVNTNGNTSSVSVLLNNGDGSLGSAQYYSAPANTGFGAVAIGDVNGDGILDLAAVGQDVTTLVLPGKGDGTFGAAISLDVGSLTTDVAVADLNNDGVGDLSTAIYDGKVSVWQGTFRPLSLELLDSSGNGLALDHRAGNLDGVIKNFVAPSAGTYYARIRGLSIVRNYDLIVTRDAEFDTGANRDLASAQAIGTNRDALGHLASPPGVVEYNGHYYVLTSNRTPWPEAEAEAVRLGGHLATINDEAENLFLTTTFVNGPTLDDNYWIGLNDYASEGNFVWSSGEPVTYTNWSPGEPDDFDSAEDGTVINYIPQQGFGLWGDIFNGAAFTGIIELTTPPAADNDWYSVSVNAGDALSINTRTPFGDPQYPFEIHNRLNPAVELYDPSGIQVAANDNGGFDGRNASISYTTLATGDYYARVFSAGFTAGEYVLSVAGTTVALPAFTVSAVDPPDGFHSRVAPTQVTVDFNDSILLTSLDASDLTVDGVPATGVTVVDGNTVKFTLPAVSEGAHDFHIAAGAIMDLQSMGNDAFTSRFTFDTTPPTVPTGLTYSISAGPTVTLSWGSSTDAQSGISAYVLYANGNQLTTTLDTSYTSPINVSQTYTYQVAAQNGALAESARTPGVLVRVMDLASAVRVDATHVRATFTEALQAASAQQVSNYLLRGVHPTAAVLEAGNTSVLLTIATPLVDGEGYRLVVNDIVGVSGAVLVPNTQKSFTAGLVNGLQGDYFNGVAPPGYIIPATSTANRIDSQISFTWLSNVTGITPTIGPTNFGVRWTGRMVPQFSETYLLTLTFNDGARVWLDLNRNGTFDEPAERIMENWTVASPTGAARTLTANVALVADASYNLNVEMFNATSSSRAQLSWQSPSIGATAVVIPNSRLFLPVFPETDTPGIADIKVKNTSWTPAILSQMHATGLGTGGIAVPVGGTTGVLPWTTGVNQVSIRFDEDVVVGANSLVVNGVNVPAYDVASFNYDYVTYTATWTLAQPIGADRVTVNLADTTDLVGNALSGGSSITIHSLPGDVDRDSDVDVVDFQSNRAAQFNGLGSDGYSIFQDMDTNGAINIVDWQQVQQRLGGSLSAPAPGAPATQSVSAPMVRQTHGVRTTSTPIASLRLARAAVDRAVTDLVPETSASPTTRVLRANRTPRTSRRGERATSM